MMAVKQTEDAANHTHTCTNKRTIAKSCRERTATEREREEMTNEKHRIFQLIGDTTELTGGLEH